MTEPKEKEFGKWRSLLWPVHNFELKKLLPMFAMFFLISLNYTILRDTKDSLIVPTGGAEVIPFIKVWGVLPMAVLFMLIYSKLSNKLSKPALFYVTITPFLVFFTLFTTVLYPMRDYLHPYAFADKLQAILPQGFAGLIAIIRHWTFSLFYVLAELWGSVALSLIFWGFANDIVKAKEARRFYSVFGAGANVALLISGPYIILVSNIRSKLPANIDAWGISLNYLMGVVVVAGLVIMGIYYWINKNVLTDTRFYNPDEIKKAKKEKPKLSLKESFLYLTKSKYMGLIAILVIAYGISINIIEVTWKSQLKLQYPNSNDYSTFMGGFSTVTGVVAIFMTLFVGSNIIRRLGWRIAAMITPIVLFVSGTIFLGCVMFKQSIGGLIGYFTASPLFFIVILGAAQNIMSKSSKYALFDPTKEMTYIPLDQESKVKGKAAVDVVGARLGKAGGSLMQQGLIISLGSIMAMTPYVAAILVGIVSIWIISVKSLHKLYTVKDKEKALEIATVEKEKIAAAKQQEETEPQEKVIAHVASSTTLK